MLDRNLLIQGIVDEFEKGLPTPGELQEKRRQLHAMGLYDLGQLYKRTFPQQDPYELRAV